MRLAFLLLSAAAGLSAQSFSFGLKAGVPLADAVNDATWRNGRYYPDSGRYLIGPMAELRLPFRLSVELDALYRSVRYRSSSSDILGGGSESTAKGRAWIFPLVGKYRLRGGLVSPYVEGGLAFQRLSLRETGSTGSRPFSNSSADTQPGFVLGAGLEGRLVLLRISPEIRYTRWSADSVQQLGGPLYKTSQFDVLVGISF